MIGLCVLGLASLARRQYPKVPRVAHRMNPKYLSRNSTATPFTDANNLVLYWGQNDNEPTLRETCNIADIVVLSFVYNFGNGNTPMYGGGNCWGSGSTLPRCTTIEADIKSCQAAGKQVFLSLGGASGNYGLANTGEGEAVATEIHNLFVGGSASNRPFGSAVVDGIDLDIEMGNHGGYTAFVNKLRSLSPGVLISGAPQCPFPDEWLGDALNAAHFDYVWVQFYNNYCNAGGSSFNWGTWSNWASSTSVNKNVRIFLGTMGAGGTGDSGYLNFDGLKSAYNAATPKTHFGGIMMWDAGLAVNNKQNGQSYADYAKSLMA